MGPGPEALTALLPSQYFANLLVHKRVRQGNIHRWSARDDKSLDRIIESLESDHRALSAVDRESAKLASFGHW